MAVRVAAVLMQEGGVKLTTCALSSGQRNYIDVIL